MGKKGEPLSPEVYMIVNVTNKNREIVRILRIAERRGWMTEEEKSTVAELRETIRELKAGKDFRRHLGSGDG